MREVNIWCNGHGWVCSFGRNGVGFCRSRAGAKPFEDGSKELLAVRIYIERNIMCNYDLVN